MPFHTPSSTSDCSQPTGSKRTHDFADARQQVAEAVESGWPMEKTTSKTPMTTSQKEQRSPDAMQQNVVDLARVGSRERRAGSRCGWLTCAAQVCVLAALPITGSSTRLVFACRSAD
jgi:hypothetical protein